MKKQDSHKHEPVKLLIFSASLRAESINTKLIKLAAAIIEKQGGVVDYASMSEFDCPSYNGDSEKTNGIPYGATEFCNRLLANDAYIIASPEYNGSMPGVIKNSIDWVSRFRPQPFNQKHGLLMSASPSMSGGNKALWSLRMPLEHLGSSVYPNMFSLAQAHQALNEEGVFINPTLATHFQEMIISFMNLVEAAKNYPSMKKSWIEFLGE